MLKYSNVPMWPTRKSDPTLGQALYEVYQVFLWNFNMENYVINIYWCW